MTEVQELSRKIEQCKDSDQANSLLGELGLVENKSIVSLTDASRLRYRLLLFAKDFTKSSPNSAKPIILEHLLPQCLKDKVKDGPPQTDVRVFRDCLSAWLEQYSYEQKKELREIVLERLCEEAEKRLSRSAIVTIWAIGYRSKKTVEVLEKLSQRADQIGDDAFEARIALGITKRDREEFIARTLRKLDEPHKPKLEFAIQELLAVEFIPLLVKRAVASDPNSIAHWLLARIADRRSADEALQDMICVKLLEVDQELKLPKHRNVALASNLFSLCDSKKVIPVFFQWLKEFKENTDELAHKRLLSYERILGCVRPRQLTGVSQCKDAEALEIIKRDAWLDTKHEGRDITHDYRIKERAVQTLFCLGTPKIEELLVTAVKNETNAYFQNEFMELAAYLTWERLPPSLLHLITSEINFLPEDNSPELFRRLGAVEIAQSSPTAESLEALLNFGVTFNGEVLTTFSDALFFVSARMIKSGDTSPVKHLFTKTVQDAPLHHRKSAISALCNLAKHKLLRKRVVEKFAQLAVDKTLPAYSRAQAFEAVSYLPSLKSHPIYPIARGLVEKGETEISHDALLLLIAHDVWKADEKFVFETLSLSHGDNGLQLTDSKNVSPSTAEGIARLYTRAKNRFSFAISQVVAEGNSDAAYTVLAQLLHCKGKCGKTIINALVNRIHRFHTPFRAEPYLFNALRRLSSCRLLREPWENTWHNWMADARVSLAQEVADAEIASEDKLRAVNLLRMLMSDGAYPVRRAAYYALSKVDSISLRGNCSSWATAKDLQLRKRAAEAFGWIPTSDLDWIDDPIYEALISDTERSVRKVACDSREQSRNRFWANRYVERIIAVRDNKSLIAAYKYGQALERIGDDTHRRDLEKHLDKTELDIPIRQWIAAIIKTLESRWQSIVRDWPQPWFNFDGQIEEFTGQAVFLNRNYPARFSLWKKQSSQTSIPGIWGGAMFIDKWDMGGLGADEVTIRAPNRWNAKAHLQKQWGDGFAVLEGISEYPSHQS